MGRVRARGSGRTSRDDTGSHRPQHHSQHRARSIDPRVRPAVLLAGGSSGVAPLAGRARSSGRGRTVVLKALASETRYRDVLFEISLGPTLGVVRSLKE